MSTRRSPSVLYVGQSYYHTWYLSRELRKLGWHADVLNWEPNPGDEVFYHGEDYRFRYGGASDAARQLAFYVRALRRYDVLHFSNTRGLRFGRYIGGLAKRVWGEGSDVALAKRLGRTIVYSNNACHDGVAQTSFAAWESPPVCQDCVWRTVPSVCSDPVNLAWGALRNRLADYQITVGANRADYNDDPRVHEVPEFYCLDPDIWHPDLLVPSNYRLPLAASTIRLYHAVGNFETRSSDGVNIKSTHLYLPLAERLRDEGHDVELIFFKDLPNRQIRFYQAQADVVLDMLTYGWFGANGREALMLGKPLVCYLRPAWLATVAAELPEYVEEMPVVSATPETVHDVVEELVKSPLQREEIGARSRAFALKWHSAAAGAARLDEIYRRLLDERRDP